MVLFDLRGCGRSSPVSDLSQYSINAAAIDVVTVAQHIGAPVHLLGFSFGGRLAIRAAQTNPECFAALILASTTPGGIADWSAAPQARDDRMAGLPNLSDALSENTAFDAGFTKNLAINSLPLDVWNLGEIPRIRTLLNKVRFSAEWGKAWQAGLLKPDNSDHSDWLRGTKIPKLVLHGEYDFRFPANGFSGMNTCDTTTIQIIKNAGHMAHLEQTEQWVSGLSDFLNVNEADTPA